MRHSVFLAVVVAAIIVISGCGRKQHETDSVVSTSSDAAGGSQTLPMLQPVRQYAVCGRHIALSPDGNYAAVAGYSNIVYLWRASELPTESIKQLKGHKQELHSCSFSADSKTLVSAAGTIDTAFSIYCELQVWNVATGAKIDPLVGMGFPAQGTAFSPDGKYLAVTTDYESVVVWSTESKQEVRRLHAGRQSKPIYAAAWSPDSRWVAAAGGTGDVVVWDAATGRETRRMEGHSNLVTSVAFDASGKSLLTSSWDRTVRLWDVASGKALIVYRGHENAVESACFSPDGKFAVSGGWDKTVRVWNTQTGSDLHVLRSHSEHVKSIAFRPGHPELFSTSDDGTVKVWDTRQLLGN